MIADTLEYFGQGGILIYPLGIVSIWMWTLIVNRMVILFRFHYQTNSSEHVDAFIKNPVRYFAITTDEHSLKLIIKRMQNDLEHQIGTIFLLATVAPLLGLLGTVTGMISTFESICRLGATNARAFAAGISEALITTQLGLVIAVPGLFMGHVIRRRTECIHLRLERFLMRKTVLERGQPE